MTEDKHRQMWAALGRIERDILVDVALQPGWAATGDVIAGLDYLGHEAIDGAYVEDCLESLQADGLVTSDAIDGSRQFTATIDGVRTLESRASLLDTATSCNLDDREAAVERRRSA